MKIIEKLKERRKRKIEEAFYKAFPEKANYVPPEKQLATMHVERYEVRPAEIVARETISDIRMRELEEETFNKYLKTEIALKIGKKALEVGLIDFKISENLYDGYSIVGTLRVLPKRDERGGFYVGN